MRQNQGAQALSYETQLEEMTSTQKGALSTQKGYRFVILDYGTAELRWKFRYLLASFEFLQENTGVS